MGVCRRPIWPIAGTDPSVSAAACFYTTDIHTGTLGAARADDSLVRMADLKAEALFVWGRRTRMSPSPAAQAIASGWRRSAPL